MYNVDVDTGGTMTDGLVSGNGQVIAVKVETTPHDLTISFMDILRSASEKLGFLDIRAFLDRVDVIRWSSTITSNVLAQRNGPKLGLLVSEGHREDLYGSEELTDKVVGSLISADDISEINSDADLSTVRRAVKTLMDKGIRRINISLRGAFEDNRRELQVADMISSDYPDHFLGSIPALAASEVVSRPDDATRTVASLINAYVHPSLAHSLYRAEEIVRDEHGWGGNILIGHIRGGVARLGKTKPFDTIESGPVFGTYACADSATRHGEDKVIAIDVGGTTAKASAVNNGRVLMKPSGSFFDIPLEMDLPVLRSISLGGGSVARVKNDRIVLGPDSMGAAPGPVCYGLGGRQATVTDAFVVAGLVSPTAFLDGRRLLDVAKARSVISEQIGDKLGLSADEAAHAIVDAAYDAVADLAREVAEEVGWELADCVLYAYGGNGPLFITSVAERLGSTRARLFRFGSVFSAYGSAISDVVHVYESAPDSEHKGVFMAGDALISEAMRDLRSEGFDTETAELSWEVRSSESSTWHEGSSLEDLVEPLGVPVQLLRLTSRYRLPSLERPELAADSESSSMGSRGSPFGSNGSITVFGWSQIVGSTMEGPLLVDGGTFTWFVTDGWDLSVDSVADGLLTKRGQK